METKIRDNKINQIIKMTASGKNIYMLLIQNKKYQIKIKKKL